MQELNGCLGILISDIDDFGNVRNARAFRQVCEVLGRRVEFVIWLREPSAEDRTVLEPAFLHNRIRLSEREIFAFDRKSGEQRSSTGRDPWKGICNNL